MLLLLLLVSDTLSLSVQIENLTSRQLRAALDTESRLGVFWCKSDSY